MAEGSNAVLVFSESVFPGLSTIDVELGLGQWSAVTSSGWGTAVLQLDLGCKDDMFVALEVCPREREMNRWLSLILVSHEGDAVVVMMAK